MLLIVPTTPTMVNRAVRPALNLLAERAARAKVFLHQILIDHDDLRCSRGIAGRERPSGDEGNAHRLEIVAADDFLPTVRQGIARKLVEPDDGVGARADVAVERDIRRQSR